MVKTNIIATPSTSSNATAINQRTSSINRIKIFKNFFSLTTAEIVNRIAGLIYLPYIARIFGPEGLGKINFAESVAGYFLLAANFGFDLIGMREVAKFKNKQNAFIHILLIEIITSFVSFAALCVFVYFIPKPFEIKMLIILYGLTLLTFAFTIDWFFLGLEWMGAVAIVSVIRQFCYIGLIIFSIHAPKDLHRLPLSFIAADVIAIIIFFYLFFSKVRKQDFKIQWTYIQYFFHEAFPLGISNFLNTSRDKVGSIVLGFMRNITEVGFYSVGYKLLCVANVIPLMLNRAIFPNMTHTLKNRTPQEAKNYIRRIFEITSLIAVPVSFFIFYNAHFLVRLIFGKNFQQGTGILRIIIWSTALLMFNKLYYYYIIAIGAQKRLFICSTISLIANITLCITLTKVWGAQGAALAFLISELILGIIYYFASGIKTAPGKEIAVAFLYFLPSLGLCILMQERLHSLINTILAIALYAVIIFKFYPIKNVWSAKNVL